MWGELWERTLLIWSAQAAVVRCTLGLGFQSQPHLLIVVGHWGSHFTYQCFSFIIYKESILIVPIYRIIGRAKRICIMHLEKCLARSDKQNIKGALCSHHWPLVLESLHIYLSFLTSACDIPFAQLTQYITNMGMPCALWLGLLRLTTTHEARG